VKPARNPVCTIVSQALTFWYSSSVMARMRRPWLWSSRSPGGPLATPVSSNSDSARGLLGTPEPTTIAHIPMPKATTPRTQQYQGGSGSRGGPGGRGCPSVRGGTVIHSTLAATAIVRKNGTI